ncbi:MAG: T9SS type A sorting domain-containing protein [Carboxylicivirga sp.]|nr:T9SS type A sorting domain-containing protein [Carboxylicivirga sp.]
MRIVLNLLFVCISISISAQNYLGLEGSVPSYWSPKDQLSISSAHYKMGSQSVEWTWTPGSAISINNPAGMANACQTYKGGMILWIYNETPKLADLKFEFRNGNGPVQYHFNYHLNFTGWRACWIRFDEDMLGVKQDKNLSKLTITAPDTESGGKLFFDRMKFPSSRINDRVTPDAQLDFINPEMNYNHWSALWHWHNTYSYEMALPTVMTDEEKANAAIIRQRITDAVDGNAPSASRLTAIQNEFNQINIQRNGDNISGAAFVIKDELQKANGDMDFAKVELLMYDMAKAWHHNKQSGFDQMFIDVLDWLYDQGLTIGSGLGTNHHYGYDFRGIPKAIWLMQDALKSAGKFQQAFEMIQYWTGVAEVRQLPQVENFQGIVDTWNTIAPGRLMAIMLREDSPELVRDIKSYVQWLNAVMQYSVGTMGGFKPDGSGFHHGMIYAGYMNGGYAGLGEVVGYLGNTEFNLSDQARSNFRQALLVHFYYANHRSIINSVCGRKPMTQELGTGAINALAYLAKATDPVDEEMATEYMRLAKYKKELYNEFKNLGIKPASAPNGNISLNYGALNLHRRDNWLVGIKGFNNIVTGTEIYTSNNRYGRYQSYGTVQILASGSPVDAETSGFKLKGWDWNRFPGATTIHLPYDLLNHGGGNLNERSKESEFAGACSLEGNGVFGMYLDENNYTNYTNDFVANKSVFSFDNRIICLGSNISNSNGSYHTETTLFQTALSNTSEELVMDETGVTQFPYSSNQNITDPITLLDTKGNGYYLPSGNVYVERSQQESRDEKKKTVNYGNFATAWLDHGTSPDDEDYEYAILVQTSRDELNGFKQKMQSEDKPYEVIRKDEIAHIVKDAASATTGYVVFKADNAISSSHLKASSYPCIVVVKDEGANSIKLAFADPAINMKAPSGLTGADIAKERLVQLTLNGRYQLADANEKCRIVSSGNSITVLEFTSIHGLSVEVQLVKDTSSGIDDEASLYNVHIYPNPVDDLLNFDAALNVEQVSIVTLDGRRLITTQPVSPIKVGDLLPGVYLMQVKFADHDEYIRFIKK